MPLIEGDNPYVDNFTVNIWPSCIEVLSPENETVIDITECEDPDYSISLCEELAVQLGYTQGYTDEDNSENNQEF
jgi:hypothetical protein